MTREETFERVVGAVSRAEQHVDGCNNVDAAEIAFTAGITQGRQEVMEELEKMDWGSLFANSWVPIGYPEGSTVINLRNNILSALKDASRMSLMSRENLRYLR